MQLRSPGLRAPCRTQEKNYNTNDPPTSKHRKSETFNLDNENPHFESL